MLPNATRLRQFQTLLRETPKVRAATAGFMPPRKAAITRVRKVSWASGERKRASLLNM